MPLKRAYAVLLLGLLLAVMVWIYRPMIERGRFVYEDNASIQNNTYVIGYEPIHLAQPRWLTWSSLRLDATVINPHAYWFHAMNVILHGLVGLALFAWLWRRGLSWGAVFAAGIVWLHPINVESVAYITSRSELILALAVLGALACAPRPDQPWRWYRLVGVVLCTYAAVGAKELGILTPLLVTLYRPLPKWFYLIGAAIAAWVLRYLYLQHTVLGASAYGVVDAFAMQCVAFWHGAIALLVPTGLTVDFDARHVSEHIRIGAVSGVLALGMLLLWNLITNLRGRVTFALLWLTFTLGPRLVAHSWETINEHQWYLPVLGLAIALAPSFDPKPSWT